VPTPNTPIKHLHMSTQAAPKNKSAQEHPLCLICLFLMVLVVVAPKSTKVHPQ
jgi:hypothetical protein